jgi:hypothetical protein
MTMAENATVTGLQIRILRFVAEVGDPTFANIQSAMGQDVDALRDPVRELVTTGLLRMKDDDIDHDWAYRLTGAGRDALASHGIGLKPEA